MAEIIETVENMQIVSIHGPFVQVAEKMPTWQDARGEYPTLSATLSINGAEIEDDGSLNHCIMYY
jgi:hypothetical protein